MIFRMACISSFSRDAQRVDMESVVSKKAGVRKLAGSAIMRSMATIRDTYWE